jgi:fatty-acyl-CoA synthase
MTETFTNATMLPFDAPYELRRSTMGRPVPGNMIRIRDRESGAEVAAGELGEITVAGMSLMRGYYKADPLLPTDAAGFLPTNDAGYMTPDGYLVFAGRLDRVIKSAGVNVSPIEIEERIQQWGRLGTCAVIGLPHPTLGQVVVLCAVNNRNDPLGEDEVKVYLQEHLASYKVPRHIVFFHRDDMPLTISSKVHVPQLREKLVDRLLTSDIDIPWKQVLARHRPTM